MNIKMLEILHLPPFLMSGVSTGCDVWGVCDELTVSALERCAKLSTPVFSK